MTVSTTSNRKDYPGDDVTTSFATNPVVFFNSTDLGVQVTVTATGVATLLVLGAHYTVSGGDPIVGAVGTVNLAGGSVPWGALLSPTYLTIIRTLPLTQTANLVNNNSNDAAVDMSIVDKLTMICQQINEVLGRSLKLASNSLLSGLTLPIIQAGKFVRGTADALNLEFADVVGIGSIGIPVSKTQGGTGIVAALGLDILNNLQTRGADIVASATLNLDTATGDIVDVTGNTGVTAVTLADGDSRWFRTTGTPIFTNGASLICPGNANYQAAAGDLFLARGYATGVVRLWALKGNGSPVVQQTGFSIINGTLVPSVGASALTVAIKTLAGADPSAADPVLVVFRNATLATGDYTTLTLTAATSVVVSSGSTLGTANNVAARLWIVGFNDAGTFRMGIVNTLSGTNIMALHDDLLYSSTAEGGAGAADSAQVIYTGTAVTTKALRILGYVEATEATAGTWATAPSKTQLFGPGVAKPGEPVQYVRNTVNTIATGTTVIPADDTIPQITEGDQYLSQAIIPSSAVNLLFAQAQASISTSAAGTVGMGMVLFQDAIANALAATFWVTAATNVSSNISLKHGMLAGIASSTTFRIRVGAGNAGTTSFNGGGGSHFYGAAGIAWLEITEIMV